MKLGRNTLTLMALDEAKTDFFVDRKVGEIGNRKLARAELIPHAIVQAFEAPYQQRHVEQHAMVTPGTQAAAQVRSSTRHSGNGDGARDIFIKIGADEIRQSGIPHQAGADARREALPSSVSTGVPIHMASEAVVCAP